MAPNTLKVALWTDFDHWVLCQPAHELLSCIVHNRIFKILCNKSFLCSCVPLMSLWKEWVMRIVMNVCLLFCAFQMKTLDVEILSFLPAGYSNFHRRFVQWSEIKDRRVFRGKGILVQSQNRSFVHFWEKVVRSAGAELPEGKLWKTFCFRNSWW